MRILYAIQGTGNGHVSRAKEIIPLLHQYGDVDLLLSGTQADILPEQDIKYRLHGFSFIFGKRGGVDHYQTWQTMDLRRFVADVRKLSLKDYNLILNDFEPVTAWACKMQRVESVGLSHQAAFQSKHVPKPRSVDWAQLILKYYAPATQYVGFHFHRYDDFIHTPVIRSEIRNAVVTNAGHYTVYLPAVDDRTLVPLLKLLPEQRWEVFSKHTDRDYEAGNVIVRRINNLQFNASLASCEGLFTGGGFEGPAEALFLGKKLLVAPMKYQYEQQCNAYALKQLGVPVIWGSNRDWLPVIRAWVKAEPIARFDFSDETAAVIDQVVRQYAR